MESVTHWCRRSRVLALAVTCAATLAVAPPVRAQESKGGFFDGLKKGLEEIGQGFERAGEEMKKALEGAPPPAAAPPAAPPFPLPVPRAAVLTTAAGPLYAEAFRNGTPEGDAAAGYHGEIVDLVQERIEAWLGHHRVLVQALDEADRVLEARVKVWGGGPGLTGTAAAWREREARVLEDHVRFLPAGHATTRMVAALADRWQDVRAREGQRRLGLSLVQSDLAMQLVEALAAHTRWAETKLVEVLVASLVTHTAEIQPRSGAPAALVARLRPLHARETAAVSRVGEAVGRANMELALVATGLEAVAALGEATRKQMIPAIEDRLGQARSGLARLQQQPGKEADARLLASVVRVHTQLLAVLKATPPPRAGSWWPRWARVASAEAQGGWGSSIVSGFKSVVATGASAVASAGSAAASGAGWAVGKVASAGSAALTYGEAAVTWTAKQTVGRGVQYVDTVSKHLADQIVLSSRDPFRIFTKGEDLAGWRAPQLARAHDVQNIRGKTEQITSTFREYWVAREKGAWGVEASKRALETHFKPQDDAMRWWAQRNVADMMGGKGMTSFATGLLGSVVLDTVNGLPKAAFQLIAATPGNHADYVEPTMTLATSLVGGAGNLFKMGDRAAAVTTRAELAAARQEAAASAKYVGARLRALDTSVPDAMKAAGQIGSQGYDRLVGIAANDLAKAKTVLDAELAAARKSVADLSKWAFDPNYKNLLKPEKLASILADPFRPAMLVGGMADDALKQTIIQAVAKDADKTPGDKAPAPKAVAKADATKDGDKPAAPAAAPPRRPTSGERQKEADKKAGRLQQQIDKQQQDRAEGKAPQVAGVPPPVPQEPGWPCPDRKQCVIVVTHAKFDVPGITQVEPMTLEVRNGGEIVGREKVHHGAQTQRAQDGTTVWQGDAMSYGYTYQGRLESGRLVLQGTGGGTQTWTATGEEGSPNSTTCRPRSYRRRGTYTFKMSFGTALALNPNHTLVQDVQPGSSEITQTIAEDTSCSPAKGHHSKHDVRNDKPTSMAGTWQVKPLP